MNQKLFDYINEFAYSEILENTNENQLVIKTDISYKILFEILESEFISDENILLEIGYYENNILDYIKLDESEYILIIKL